jgi:class 3 adenylate cyclase
MAPTTRNLVVMFADISGSTKLYELLGNADALATIDRCLEIAKRVCVDFDGRVVKTIGDEVLAVFPAADGAAQAAIEIQLRMCKQRTPRDTPVTMHIGFHSGPTIEDESDVFGDAVNVAARLTAFATGGQIFTSGDCCRAAPVLHGATRDQDSHTVRGKEQDIAVFELTWAESRIALPCRLRSLAPRRSS